MLNINTQLPFCHLDDESFKLAVFELNHGDVPFDPERLETLLFNPVDRLSRNLDLDPDNQFCNTPDSSYLTPGQFNSGSISKTKVALSLLHLNA